MFVFSAAVIVQKLLPIISEPTFAVDVHRELASETAWTNIKLQDLLLFAWGLTLRHISQSEISKGE